MPAQSWLYTCAVPVSVQCANAHLPSIGGDLVPDKTALILNLVPVNGSPLKSNIMYSACAPARAASIATRSICSAGARLWLMAMGFGQVPTMVLLPHPRVPQLLGLLLLLLMHSQNVTALATAAPTRARLAVNATMQPGFRRPANVPGRCLPAVVRLRSRLG